MLNIGNIFEEVFTRKGMGVLITAWLRIKNECNEKDIDDISYKLII